MPLRLLEITGWQADRRQAIALLRVQMDRAAKAKNWPAFNALCTAHFDVSTVLRERAIAEIAEGVSMAWAHEEAA